MHYDREHLKDALEKAKTGIGNYLKGSVDKGFIPGELAEKSELKIFKNLEEWLFDDNMGKNFPSVKEGIIGAIEEKRWSDLAEAYWGDIAFGTSGIRGFMAFNEDELKELSDKGIDAPILRGPNMFNDVTFSKVVVGILRYLKNKGLSNVVIGFDVRIRGRDFAELAAKLFVQRGFKVWLFGEMVAVPELFYSVNRLKADFGLYISASHNDRRYNGFKVCSATGAMLEESERNDLYENYIQKLGIGDLPDIGGLPDINSSDGVEFLNEEARESFLVHMQKFFIDRELIRKEGPKLIIGYSSFHGVGIGSVPPLLHKSGFTNVQVIRSMAALDGFFPAFSEHPEQQPDPGDEISADIAVENYRREYPDDFEKERMDILIGTDPDADRASVVVRVPKGQIDIYKKPYVLLTANEAWLLVLWYRLKSLKELGDKFAVYTHVTTDAFALLSRKYGIGIVKTWVGIPMIGETIRMAWEGKEISERNFPRLVYDVFNMNDRRTFNIGGFEESSGFGFFGGPPRTPRDLGEGGHVKDKDGILGALMLTEIASYAKSVGKTLIDLVDEIYLDPAIGLFVNYYEPDPRFGVYRGLEGFSKKINILRKAVEIMEKVKKGEEIKIAGLKVTRAEQYQLGRYDAAHNWIGFPDEGVRFYFNDDYSWITLRPSGNQQAHRFYAQLRFPGVTRDDILAKKKEGRLLIREMVKDLRRIVGA